jgi:MFS family permease
MEINMASHFRPRLNVLSSTVIRLGLVSFFADISSEMLYPITPIFLTTTLGASMLSVGLIEGVAESIASLLKTYSGAYSDKIRRRRPFIISGYFLAAIAKPIIGVATGWPLVLFARGLDRTGKGIRTAPRDALISDSVSPEVQGEAFGWHRLMDTMGAAIGPLFAIVFLSRSAEDLRPLYFWALIPGIASVAIAFSVREVPRDVKVKAQARRTWRWRDASSSFKTYLVAWGVFSIANSSDVFLIIKAKSMGVSLPMTILMYCFYNLVYALSSPYLGRLSDGMKRRNLLIAGLVFFAVVYLGFAVATSAWQFWALFAAYGLYMGSTDGVGKALVVDLVPPEFKGTAIGMLGTVSGISILVASSVAGFLWDRVGSGATFIYGAVGALAAILILSFLPERKYE